MSDQTTVTTEVDAFVAELMESMDWTGTGSNDAGDQDRHDHEKQWVEIKAASEEREAALQSQVGALYAEDIEPCRKGCFSGGCGPCWATGCDHHGTLVAALATQQAATTRDAALLAQGAEAERQDILAGVREHIPACEDERGGRYDCIHGIDSATGTVVLRLAELHREGVALLSQPQKAVCRDCGGPSDGYLILSPELTEHDECPPFCERCGRAYCVKHLDATWLSKETE